VLEHVADMLLNILSETHNTLGMNLWSRSAIRSNLRNGNINEQGGTVAPTQDTSAPK